MREKERNEREREKRNREKSGGKWRGMMSTHHLTMIPSLFFPIFISLLSSLLFLIFCFLSLIFNFVLSLSLSVNISRQEKFHPQVSRIIFFIIPPSILHSSQGFNPFFAVSLHCYVARFFHPFSTLFFPLFSSVSLSHTTLSLPFLTRTASIQSISQQSSDGEQWWERKAKKRNGRTRIQDHHFFASPLSCQSSFRNFFLLSLSLSLSSSLTPTFHHPQILSVGEEKSQKGMKDGKRWSPLMLMKKIGCDLKL